MFINIFNGEIAILSCEDSFALCLRICLLFDVHRRWVEFRSEAFEVSHRSYDNYHV